VEAALVDALRVERTGRRVITEVCRQLRPVFRNWQQRDRSGLERVYLFLDGIDLRRRPEDKKAIAVLCAYGIVADGRTVRLHLEIGDKVSRVCWEAFFEDIKRRGLKTPLMSVIAGNVGSRRALRAKRPESRVQRCHLHNPRHGFTARDLVHSANRNEKERMQQACAPFIPWGFYVLLQICDRRPEVDMERRSVQHQRRNRLHTAGFGLRYPGLGFAQVNDFDLILSLVHRSHDAMFRFDTHRTTGVVEDGLTSAHDSPLSAFCVLQRHPRDAARSVLHWDEPATDSTIPQPGTFRFPCHLLVSNEENAHD
jgi:hypothetical protein